MEEENLQRKKDLAFGKDQQIKNYTKQYRSKNNYDQNTKLLVFQSLFFEEYKNIQENRARVEKNGEKDFEEDEKTQ